MFIVLCIKGLLDILAGRGELEAVLKLRMCEFYVLLCGPEFVRGPLFDQSVNKRIVKPFKS